MNTRFRTGIGQSLRRFVSDDSTKPCTVGGVIIEDMPGMQADWDGDVVFEAIIQAIASVIGKKLFTPILTRLFEHNGITDSTMYLKEAVQALEKQEITHIAISIEGNQPTLENEIDEIQRNIARILHLSPTQVGITCTSGDGLTDCGCGDGLHAIAILTTEE